jgi:RhtB (resistance to homoserine/threonine) family protein
MSGITNFTAFAVACILLNMTPGSDTMYILLGRSISQGRTAGVLSALGISAGCMIHTLLAGFGLSLIVSQSEMAFHVIKYLGAAYLFYLGVSMIMSSRNAQLVADEKPMDMKRIFISGVITNVLNPKVALFFLAFLPQFVDAGQADSAIPFLLLGATFTTTGTIWCLGLAIFASMISKRIRQNPSIKKWLDRVTGMLFVALGIRLAFQSRQ